MRVAPNNVPYSISIPNNMGMVRYFLAFSVLISHFNLLTGGSLPFPISSYTGVGGFFALSGFLIYGSYLKKNNLKNYLRSRAVRLLPAYWFAVIFFSILCFFTTELSFYQYFGSFHYWKYLIFNLLFLNFICPTLPGVFESYAIPAVNISLWTMKIEWLLYLSVPFVVWLINKTKVKPQFMFVGIFILSVIYRYVFIVLYINTENELFNILGRQFVGQLMYFYIGVLIYYYYDSMLRYKWQLLIVSVVLMFLSETSAYIQVIAHPLAWGVLVVWLSMIGRWGTSECKYENVSYTIYLVHAPVIQLIVWRLIPQSIGYIGSLLLVCCICISLGIIISKYIEQPLKIAFNTSQSTHKT